MDRPEPRTGDPLLNRGYRTTIHSFCEDRGTYLSSGGWVCISEFEKGADGVWRRPEPHGLPDLVDLEQPVGESAPDDLEEAARLLRAGPTRFTRDPGTAELLASALDEWVRIGRLELDILNRTGGPEMVRLARHIDRLAA